MRIINDFNLKKQAEDLGVKMWQTPGGLFIIMGFIAASFMTATYIISKNYNDPQVLIISECLVVILILSIGTSITRFIEQIINLNKMKSEFISVASHQLRTPLSAIKWETELLLTKFNHGLNQKQLKNIENIAMLSRKMAKLVGDLLDVARIEQNRLILRRKNFNLLKVAEESLKEFLVAARSRHIKVVCKMKNNLPLVFGDPEKVKLVMDNLISNAIKYSVSGGHVEIKIFEKDNQLIFEIKDNGVGIPEEQLKRVFEKFFRSDNAVKYQTEGTGLGLYIAKNVVEQLGGKIWFQSIENVGSLFGFSLPKEKKVIAFNKTK